MSQDSLYTRMRTAGHSERARIYAQIYDAHATAPDAVPELSKRRRTRLALYSRIIGPGHEAILELGCGGGDLTCVLAGLGRQVVGIDMSGASLGLARMRAARLPADLAARVQ